MAKRKKKHHHRSTRRRVSGIGGGSLMEIATLAGGCVLAQIAAQKFDKVDHKIMAAAQLAGGLFLSSKGKGIVASLGKGVAVSGLISGAKVLKIISGIGAAPLVTFDNNSLGFPNTPVIQGFQNPNNVMSGMNEMSVISGATESYY